MVLLLLARGKDIAQPPGGMYFSTPDINIYAPFGLHALNSHLLLFLSKSFFQSTINSLDHRPYIIRHCSAVFIIPHLFVPYSLSSF
jgi:hypothetical protein